MINSITRSSRLRQHLLNWLTPAHSCFVCGTDSNLRICDDCQQYLVRPDYSCRTCGLPLPHSALFCGECLQHAPTYDEAISPFIYQTPLDQLINDFKHQGRESVGKALSQIFCQSLDEHYQSRSDIPQLIAPVPLHWWRQWQRGFNQTQLFAEDLSEHFDRPLFTHIKRRHSSHKQQGLSRNQRLRNLTDAFKVTRSLHGEHIAIVDDVMTTGTTANALAKVLKAKGAGKVTIWTLARTPLKSK